MKEKSMLKGLRAFLLLAVAVFCLSAASTTSHAATEAAKESFKREVTEMIYSVDTSTHNVYKYRLTLNEFNEVINSIKYGEDRLMWFSYYSSMHVSANTVYSKIYEIHLENTDDNVLSRYEVLSANVENILAGLKDDMTDLDKIIYFHNCLVEICSYKYSGYQSYGACGALGENQAVCAGYTKALNMLLDMEGIPAKYISSPTINHGWTLVQLDGEWYHIDATWDDTQSGVWNQVGHKYLLRNDDEFSGSKSHVEWNDPGASYHSTSTRFTDWYVHDIVGKMIFDGGYWYYVDTNTNCLMKATATGDDIQVIVDGTDKKAFKLQSVENGVATYTCNRVTYTSDKAATPSSTPAPKTEVTATAPVETPSTTPAATTVGQVRELSGIEFKNVAEWQMKKYNSDTKTFESSQTHFGLASYCLVEPTTKYTVSLSDANLGFRITELDKDYNALVVHTIPSGTDFVTSSACKYVTVELYCMANEWNYNSKSFKSTFQASDFVIDISIEVSNLLQDNYTWNTIDEWRVGTYQEDNGIYTKGSKTRICLNDYLFTKANETYSVSLNNSKYRMQVAQYDSTYKFITSGEYTDGDTFTVSDKCSYLGVTIYSPSLEWTLSYSSFKDLFVNGFIVSLNRQKVVQEELAEEEPEVESLYPSITSINLSDFSNWQIGQYNSKTVLVESSKTRVCLNSYYSVKSTSKYGVSISDNNLAFNIYELNYNHELIICHTVYDGDSFTTAGNCSYVGVELYCPSNEWNYQSKYYKTKVFGAASFDLRISPEGKPAPVNNIEWSDINDWRVGTYSTENGAYTKQKTRICLKDYLYVLPNTTFIAGINDSNYKLLIAQYDSHFKFISSQSLSNGDQLTVADNCVFLGVSVYSPSLEWTLSLNSYNTMFENDLVVSLSKILSIDDTDIPAAEAVPITPIAPFVVISIVAILGVGAFIFYKKRKSA